MICKGNKKQDSYRVITEEWLKENGFSSLDDVIKRIENKEIESRQDA